MSDKRKLNSEIDRTFKKIQEGLELFDSTWTLLQEADTSKVREKYEEEVNNHIKKLQRLRDHVRGWIASGEVKDKEPLHKARRDVETRMEKLRDYERDAKTKEYSRAGLAQEKVDPEQKNRSDSRQWLSDSIGQLTCHIEQFESEMEAMDCGGSRKKLDGDKQDKHDFLEKGLLSHRAHLAKFEAMLRMLDNETLSPKTIFGLKDEFEFYMDQAADGHLSDVDHDTMYYGIEFENEQGDILHLASDQSAGFCNGLPEAGCKPETRDAVVPNGLPTVAGITSISTPALRPTKIANVAGVPTITGSKTTIAMTLQKDLHLPKAAQRTQIAVGRTIRRSATRKLVASKEESKSPAKANSNGFIVGSGHVATVGSSPHKRRSFPELLSHQSAPSSKLKHVIPATKTTTATSPIRTSQITSPFSTAQAPTPSSPRQAVRKAWNAWEDSVSREKELIQPAKMELGQPVVSAAFAGQTAQPATNDVIMEAKVYSLAADLKAHSSDALALEERAGMRSDVVATHALHSFSDVLPSYQIQSPFADLNSSLEPNSTEQIWKAPASALDWPSSTTCSTDSSPGWSFPSITSPLLLSDPIWTPPMFGSVPRAEEYFGAVSPKQPLSSLIQLTSQSARKSAGIAVFESDVHWKLSTEVMFYVFYFQGDKQARVCAAKDLERRNWSFYTKLSVWMQRMDYPRLQTPECERGNFRYWDKDNWKEEKLTDFLVEYCYVKNPSEELMRTMP